MYIMGTLLRHGSRGAEAAATFPQIAAGELRLQAFGVTEPDAGLDTTRIRTRARRDGDRYVVNGQKIWTSRALEQSDLMLLLARTTPIQRATTATQGLSMFLVDLRSASEDNLRIQPIETMLNHTHDRALHRRSRDPGR